MKECNNINKVELTYISALAGFLRNILAFCILPSQSVAYYSQINSVYFPKQYQPNGLRTGEDVFM
jgi:hypothetical protein